MENKSKCHKVINYISSYSLGKYPYSLTFEGDVHQHSLFGGITTICFAVFLILVAVTTI